jgi:GNAT superfamily N-acetyltransferase
MPSLRPAVVEDQPFLLDLTARLAAFDVPPWRTPREITRGDDEILLAALHEPTADTLILVALDEAGERAGYVFASTKTDYFTRERHAHVEVLAVRKEHEGQGFGRLLLDAAETWARERGDRFITLNAFEKNTRARQVYERLDYQPETIHYRKNLTDPAE